MIPVGAMVATFLGLGAGKGRRRREPGNMNRRRRKTVQENEPQEKKEQIYKRRADVSWDTQENGK